MFCGAFWKVFEQSEGQDQIILLAYLNMAVKKIGDTQLKWSDVDFINDGICLWTKKREGGHN